MKTPALGSALPAIEKALPAANMAGALLPIGGFIYDQISGTVGNNKADQAYRTGWTQQQLGVVSAANPGKNVVIVDTKHDASGLQGVVQSQLQCQNAASKTDKSYDCYVFDSGLFVLQGDG